MNNHIHILILIYYINIRIHININILDPYPVGLLNFFFAGQNE